MLEIQCMLIQLCNLMSPSFAREGELERSAPPGVCGSPQAAAM